LDHRTSDQCALAFKQTGRQGKDDKISDSVRYKGGEVSYEVAGQWNSQLIRRAISTGSGFLHRDAYVSSPSSPNYTAEYILWRNSERKTAPFNLIEDEAGGEVVGDEAYEGGGALLLVNVGITNRLPPELAQC
jgi:hypothetical protein